MDNELLAIEIIFKFLHSVHDSEEFSLDRAVVSFGGTQPSTSEIDRPFFAETVQLA